MDGNIQSEKDREYMKIALEFGKKGMGKVSPNPLVGAVVVKGNRIIGKGYHKVYGKAHAEVHALEEAGENARNSTIYVTLEPCSHYGKTPPCVEKIIKSGIKRCVIGSKDPNPKVAGKGMEILGKHGIEVIENVLKEECDQLNQDFFKYIKSKIPYLFLKCGITLDGKIALSNGISKWITNEKAREKVQYYRNRFMGIMVGINTVMYDNPSMTVRIKDGNNPFRIIVDPDLQITDSYNVIKNNSDEKTVIITSNLNKNSEKYKILQGKNKVKFIFLEGKIFTVSDMLREIGKEGISSILLEGGETLISKAFSEKIIDGGEIFIGNKIFGDNASKPFISGFVTESINEAIILSNVKYNVYNENVGMEFYMKKYDEK
ncbi:MAG: bifunctional diaminohydroxyphosphoribosylaminopyrimidine deaminase/5-amino-6-(5-phosphoribosylamino)uracil reductase RibD [Leptotrichiaceae bacterium]|nr:bifunctional diaminohydroxyphosphoribosylaminopyrimidine deaminase/5-amino-6-(5-phosphoribosylamino)uracil reductase RibD [Leptotrichiaceae bacterium]